MKVNDKFGDTSDDKFNDKSDGIFNDKSGAKTERDCVLCGCCLEQCPLFAATGREELSPRAKALLAGPSKFAAATLDEAAVAELAGLCLACGKCEKLCPQGVSVPRLIARLRAEHPDFRQWLWKQWITRLKPFWSLAAKGAALMPESMTSALAPAGLGLALKGLRGLRPGLGLRPWLAITKFPAEAYRQKHADRPVVLFDGCVGSGPRKVWADTARRLLRGLGANLAEAGFSCCGSTLGVAGLPGDQLAARRANVAAWRKAGRPLVVTYCATCRKGLAEYVGPEGGAGLFADAEEEAAWTASVTPLSALLAGAQAKAGRGAPAIVGWHKPCHADLGVGPADSDFKLMGALLGARLRTPAKAGCCGFGGIMQLGAPELSARVGAACWDGLDGALGFSAAPEVTPAYVLTDCSGCVMQLCATAPQGARVGHWLEVIAAK
ncbi:MAG: (Fe-S)-binding protein [Humidesulfovibrio sp.]|uniref:(Fe-S)-binding protein n=1 Tax=Humidesulfovibrio sp. TaxID=2910988 RepID=UPI0027F5C9A6|nr:(Fe-S)-binding protein [Humidesulfovibrio sp.]MDQ7834962.1 (Fe-S)-binding protein [Humidesulfovibrio sp.]